MEFLDFISGGLPLWSLLIVCPMLFIAGFVDAIGGGGGLISIPAFLFCGLPAHYAIGTNKMSMVFGTAISTFRYARQGFMDWAICIPAAVAALLGSSLGAQLSLIASETFIMIMMLAVIPVAGFYTLVKKDLVNDKPPHSKSLTTLLCCLIAFVIGMYDGFYGPGTGTFLLLLLTGLARQDVFKAAGTTKVINLTTNAAALVVFLTGGTVLVGLGIMGAISSIIGNWFGAKFFTEKGAAIVRPIILIVLVIFAARIILQLLGIF